MRWAVVTHEALLRKWVVEYHRGRSRQLLYQGDMFICTRIGYQHFYTEGRARCSAETWEKKGRNLPTERWNEKQKAWE